MFNIIKYVGIIVFFACLVIMYATNHGIRGIRKYDTNFRLLDMQYHYSATTVFETFEKIGENGRKAYRNYWFLDFVFIVCFLIVQITISNSMDMNGILRNSLIGLSLFRALFDILENCILIYLIGKFPIQHNVLATVCAYITTSKFIVLFLWILGIGSQFLSPVFKNISK